ncbi:MAG: hypothetical protein WCB63_04215 [Polyangiales bacterium]
MRSRTGTDVDGSLTLIDGRFVPDRHALRLFDYFLSNEGEVSPERIGEMVQEAARARVPSDQLAAVMTLLDEYLQELGVITGRAPAGSATLRRR